MTIRPILFAMLLVACADRSAADANPGAPGATLFSADAGQQWRLPDELREISGLAVAPDGGLFAHDDERAIVYEIDPQRGMLLGSFALGEPALTGDFEGLAIGPDGVFWLITSEGELYRFNEGADGASMTYERFDVGLREVCEIEGLAYMAPAQSLIIACKRNHARSMRNVVSLYLWPFEGAAQRWRFIDEAAIAGAAGAEDFRPSSIEVDPVSGRILLLSARDSVLAELSDEGEVLSARRLAAVHVQPEGVTVLPDGSLIIGDEGERGRALLSRYVRAP